METSKVIHAIYTDDDVLMSAVKKVKAERYHIEEIYTPFPVHQDSHNIIYIWSDRSNRGCLDDELYDDRGLASKYWWKAKF